MTKALCLAVLFAILTGCSYVGSMVSQAGYSMRQRTSPGQRVYKHMLDRDTFFVFGRIEQAENVSGEAIAVIAVSDKFRPSEVVDVNHVARPDSYYGLNLPAGEYRLLVLSDRVRCARPLSSRAGAFRPGRPRGGLPEW